MNKFEKNYTETGAENNFDCDKVIRNERSKLSRFTGRAARYAEVFTLVSMTLLSSGDFKNEAHAGDVHRYSSRKLLKELFTPRSEPEWVKNIEEFKCDFAVEGFTEKSFDVTIKIKYAKQPKIVYAYWSKENDELHKNSINVVDMPSTSIKNLHDYKISLDLSQIPDNQWIAVRYGYVYDYGYEDYQTKLINKNLKEYMD